jgi:dTDP-4-amino-4,6-dideoxygalactose transaminase
MINVTKPFVPPVSEYNDLVQGIFQRSWFTNDGPLLSKLELDLKEYLDVPHLLYVTNGTIALQLAIKALKLSGDIITTPFSYVATTSSIVWEGCNPVFADINPKTLNIDPTKIESLITESTSAILATHVYGNACDIESIEKIAKRHNLKVIYDGAHAFGTTYKGRSIFNYGDVSTCSFHATKLYHTVEGGSIVSQDPDLIKKMARLRSFGHVSATEFDGCGINGKNSEMHAAMGICNLRYITDILESRKRQSFFYTKHLQHANVSFQKIEKHTAYNYAYFPVILSSETELLECISELQSHQVFPRRYFYPSLNTLDYVTYNECPISEDISKRIVCLPLFYDLREEEQLLITRTIQRTLNN